MNIQLKRAYDDPEKSDGYRVLVDRLWPRGVRKEDLQLDAWMKEIAPSTELRQWFDHEPKKFEKFKERYKSELQHKEKELAELSPLAHKKETITLIYAAKDQEHNHARVLKEYLSQITDDS